MDNTEALSDLLAQCIRVGSVTGRDPGRMRLQVTCQDTVTGPFVSDWLQMLTPRASQDCQYDLPDVGDQVLCLFLPHGREQGFVLGAMYAASAPPVADGDKLHRTFRDGTVLEYDRKAHKLTGAVKGDVDLDVEKSVIVRAGKGISMETPASIALKAPRIHLAGNLSQEGYDGGLATSELRGDYIVREGGVDVPDRDVTAGAVSVRGHIHRDVESGSGVSGAPVGGA